MQLNEGDESEQDEHSFSVLEVSRTKSHTYSSFRKKGKSQLFFDEEDSADDDKDFFGVSKHKNKKMIGDRLLFTLQEHLHRQLLLLEKEQSEKLRLRREIQEEMKNYYTLMIEAKESNDFIVKEDGFDNCYNFIKDVVVNVSRFYRVGVLLLMNCTITENPTFTDSIFLPDYRQLVKMCVSVFYERVEETDPYLKQVTKLVCVLLDRLPGLEIEEAEKNKKQLPVILQEVGEERVFQERCKITLSSLQCRYLFGEKNAHSEDFIHSNLEKVSYFFAQYMEKQSIRNYFQILSNSLLKKIEEVSFSKPAHRRVAFDRNSKSSLMLEGEDSSFQLEGQSSTPSSSFQFDPEESNWLEFAKPFESLKEQKRGLATVFLANVFSEADLSPNSLKIPLRYFYESSERFYSEKCKSLGLSSTDLKKICSLKVWELVEPYYLKGIHENFSQSVLVKAMTPEQKENLKEIRQIVEMYLKVKKRQEFARNIPQLLKVTQKCLPFIVKVVEKLLTVNQERYGELKKIISSFPQVTKNQSISKIERSQSLRPQSLKELQKQALKDQNSYLNGEFSPKRNSLSPNSPKKMNRKESVEIEQKQQSLTLPPQLIKILGGCVSFKQLYILLKSLKLVRDKIPNERIANRVGRIFDMSPDLDILLPKDSIESEARHVILTELQYHELIEEDYQKMYSREYEGNAVKNIARQIISELRLNEIQKKIKRGDLVSKSKVNIFEIEMSDIKMTKKEQTKVNKCTKKVGEQPTRAFTVLLGKMSECQKMPSAPLELRNMPIETRKKVKYLLWLFEKFEVNEFELLTEMLDEAKLRMRRMNQLYEHTKFGLLAVIGNIRHYKSLLLSRQESRRRVEARIRNVESLEQVPLSLCLTSPDSRNNTVFEKSESEERVPSETDLVKRSSFAKDKLKKVAEQSPSLSHRDTDLESKPVGFNRLKYRVSNADDIILCETEECLHNDNIFLGLSHHFNSVPQFLDMFVRLKEVSEAIYFASPIIDSKTQEAVFAEIQEHSSSNGFKLPRQSNHFHYFHSEFQSSKYKRISFSVDKINKTVYHFIDILMHKTVKPFYTKSEQNELKKTIKEIIFRGLHDCLVRKSTKSVPHNPVQHLKLSRKEFLHSDRSSMIESIEDEIDRGSPEKGKQNAKYLSFLSSGKSSKNSKRHSKIVDDFDSSYNEQSLSRSPGPKVAVQKQSTIQQNIQDRSIYQTRNDQILVHQIKRLNSNYHRFFSASLNDCSSPYGFEAEPKGSNSAEEQSAAIHIRQIEEVCARFVRKINSKESPQQKIEYLRNMWEIYQLVVEREIKMIRKTLIDDGAATNSTSNNSRHEDDSTQFQANYSFLQLIFMAVLIAEPPNFVTNLAQLFKDFSFIEIFLSRDRLLSREGKLLNDVRTVVRDIFTMQIDKYVATSTPNSHLDPTKDINAQIKEKMKQASVFDDGDLALDLRLIRSNSQIKQV